MKLVSGSRVTVRSGAGEKEVDLAHLLGLNPQLLGGEPLSGAAARVFRPGAAVLVRRSSGDIEPSWQVAAYDGPTGRVLVERDDLSKWVPSADLLRLKPELVVAGLPLVVPRTQGPAEQGWTSVGGGPGGVLVASPFGEQKRIPIEVLLPLNPQLLETDPAPTVSGGLARRGGEQSDAFAARHVIPGKEPIGDGFTDGGRSARVDEKGFVQSSREVLVVDRARDGRLRGHLAVARGLRDLPEPARARALLEHVAVSFQPPGGRSALSADHQLTNRFSGREVLIGEIPELVGGGVCRHRALMLKLLGDEAGLDIALVRGAADFGPGARGGHAWNVVRVDGRPFLADPMNPTRANGVAQLVPLDDPSLRDRYLDVRGQPLYGEPR